MKAEPELSLYGPRLCATCGFNLSNGTCPTYYWRPDGKEICVTCYHDLFKAPKLDSFKYGPLELHGWTGKGSTK